jgi:hypothetical protein
MSVNTSGGPLPEVRNAASPTYTSAPSTSTNPAENSRLEDPAGAAFRLDASAEDVQETRSSTSASSKDDSKLKWYQYLGRGMYMDVKSRLPYYVSDWTDAWNYRVVPATLVSIKYCMTKTGSDDRMDQVIFFANVSALVE